MTDYDDVVQNYKDLVVTEGLEAAEQYLNQTFNDTAIPEEVSKEIEVFLVRQDVEAAGQSNDETPVTAEPTESTVGEITEG